LGALPARSPWLQIDAPALSDLAVAWFESVTNAQRRSGIRHARHGLLATACPVRWWKWSVLIAVMIRYADQPHLIRDLRAATGQTPAAYMQSQSPR
jgi:hypothetical protein